MLITVAILALFPQVPLHCQAVKSGTRNPSGLQAANTKGANQRTRAIELEAASFESVKIVSAPMTKRQAARRANGARQEGGKEKMQASAAVKVMSARSFFQKPSKTLASLQGKTSPARSVAAKRAPVASQSNQRVASEGPLTSVARFKNVRLLRQVGGQQQAAGTVSGENKCALILQRTYVRKLSSNDIDDNQASAGLDSSNNEQLEPTGRTERVCIKFEDINQAIREAKQRRRFRSDNRLAEAVQSIEPPSPIIAQLGELNQEATKILAEKFDLSAEEIHNGLPLIDMTQTEFWKICPLMVKPIQCDATGRFRSFTGHCNNLANPSWGAAQTPFVRYLAPRHPDGIEKDRVSVLDGSPLPPPRLVTSIVHRDHDNPSGDLSLLLMVWGQIIDHDVAQAAPPRSKFRRRNSVFDS